MEWRRQRRGGVGGLVALSLIACHPGADGTKGPRGPEPCPDAVAPRGADARARPPEEPCAIVARLQRAALAAAAPESGDDAVAGADSMFRRCQRLDAGAVGLVVTEVGRGAPRRQPLVSFVGVYVGEHGDVTTSSAIRSVRPERMIVRARGGEPPFVALEIEAGPLAQDPGACASTMLVEVPFGRGVGGALAPEALSSMIFRSPTKASSDGASTLVRWTHFEWTEQGAHRLDIRLPGTCTRTPIAYGGHRFEASPGLEASLRFDDDFAVVDGERSLKASLEAACDAAGSMDWALPEHMVQAAFCERLHGAPSSAVRASWEKRCDSLARLEEAWGAKHWTSGRAPSPEAERARPPIPPRLCFLEPDRLWDADYTAQSTHHRPPAVMPDDFVDLLERVRPLLQVP